jgi:1,4-dihydroxy-2-naphthoate octaprenyltransferase
MNQKVAKGALLLLQMARPGLVLLAMALYGLGGAIIAYLGFPLQGDRFWLGMAFVTFLVLMGSYLDAYRSPAPFTRSPEQRDDQAAPQREDREMTAPLDGNLPLTAAGFCLALAATVVYIFLLRGGLAPAAWLLIILLTLLAAFFRLRPFDLSQSGYGELLLAAGLGGLVPSLAFVLQEGTFHRLLAMSTSPLIGLIFAQQLIAQLERYAADLKRGQRNLMIRAGWQLGMRIHDASLIAAVICGALAYLAGLPANVASATLLILPLAGAQLWQMHRIRSGAPPPWRWLRINSHAMIWIHLYLQYAGYLLV